MTAPQFEQGNQARLDITRDELRAIRRAVIRQRDRDLEKLNIKRKDSHEYYTNLVDVYDNLVEKVREALDRYE
jgi:deoxyadenosine/deoxycytidine kinase